MEIKCFKREVLSPELQAFVMKLLNELWIVEEPYLNNVLPMHNGVEGLINDCYKLLDCVLVGFVEDQPVGFIANHVESSNEITKLVIASEHKRKGYGRCLVNALCLTLDTWLEVIITPGNKNAVDFYKDTGFDIHEHECGDYMYLIGTVDRELNHA